MSYDDEIRELEAQVLRERSRQESLPKIVPPSFENPDELISFLRQMPVQKHVIDTTLGTFLRRYRTNAGLRLGDVAEALKLTSTHLKELESRETLPWNLSALMVASIICNYRLHIGALERLTRNSYHFAFTLKRIDDPNATVSLLSTWLEAVRLEIQSQGENDLLE